LGVIDGYHLLGPDRFIVFRAAMGFQPAHLGAANRWKVNPRHTALQVRINPAAHLSKL
jgi:hypothetical protein